SLNLSHTDNISSLYPVHLLPPRSTLFPYTTLFRSQTLQVDECVFSYSDIHYQDVMRISAIENAAGADFKLLGPTNTMLKSHKPRSEEHTSELQSRFDLVCRLLLEKKKNRASTH